MKMNGIEALERGDFAVLHESFELLAKAAEMQPTRITLSDESAVPPLACTDFWNDN